MTHLSAFARTVVLLCGVALGAGACAKKEEAKPPERVTHVTVAKVVRKDLPITETAVGQETAIGYALDYDPTRVGGGTLTVRLPFPEHVAARLRVGQAVTLSSFGDARRVESRIREIRPALNATTLTREVIVSVNRADWNPVGSIRGEVVLGVRKDALIVPEQAVVLRRAGTVVYVLDGDVARERPVKTGIARQGHIEIVSGVQATDTVVVDGAALLTDGARVKVREGTP